MKIVPLVFLFFCALWAACAGDGSAPPADATSTTSASGSGGSFVVNPDGGAGPRRCDFIDPDCEPGEKCVAYDLDGDATPEETRCVPVMPGAGAEGAPCQRDPSTGADDCALGLSCFDAEDGAGFCTPNCVAPNNIAICTNPDQRCLPGGGPLQICLGACDPRDAQCEMGEGCYPSSEWLLCLPDVSGDGGVAGDACSFLNGCDSGLACIDATEVATCDAAMCCRPFCTIGDDSPCDAGETCTAWLADAPAGLEDLGACRVTSQ